MEINEAICTEKHDSDRLRITALEESLKLNLERIYSKLEKFGQRPSWSVTIVISGLFTSCGMLIMWIITHPAKP